MKDKNKWDLTEKGRMYSILLISFFILICIRFIELNFYVSDQGWMEKCLQLLTWILKLH